MKRVLFIMNPTAGRAQLKNDIFEIIYALTKADYRVTVRPTLKAKEGREIIQSESSQYDLIIAAGGDGTLNDIVTGYMASNCQVPLGYIPTGSTNDFARSLQLPLEVMPAINNIVSGVPFAIDIGSITDVKRITKNSKPAIPDYFVYIAAFGAFTELAYSTDQQIKNALGHAAYVMSAIASIGNITSYKATIRYDDQEIYDDFIYAMITNSLSVGGFPNVSATENIKFDDGEFECLMIKSPNNPIELQSIINSLLINEVNSKYMYCFKTSKLEIISEEKIPWTLDGEFGGERKHTIIENHQKAVKIIL